MDLEKILLFGVLLGLASLVIEIAFFIWLIKKGVKNALNEFFVENYDDMCEDIKYTLYEAFSMALKENVEKSNKSIDE